MTKATAAMNKEDLAGQATTEELIEEISSLRRQLASGQNDTTEWRNKFWTLENQHNTVVRGIMKLLLVLGS